jgi:hypothetical protein
VIRHLTRCFGIAGAAAIVAVIPSGNAFAQGASGAPPVTRGAVSINVASSNGTQRQNSVTSLITVSNEAGRGTGALHRLLKLRGDVGYGTAQKAEQPKITTNELFYGELQYALDVTAGDRDNWVYGIASAYHHLAFGLRVEQAYGAGITYDVNAVPGLVVGADLRHIDERFNVGPDFSSWAARVNETYSHIWTQGTGAAARNFVFTEAVEVTPAFKSSRALQGRLFTTVALPLTTRFSVPVTYGVDELRNAAPGYKPRYSKLTIGLSYSFGPS